MIIKRALHSGFCFGVQRAITLAEDAAKKGQALTIGPLIHNKDEVNRLEDLGVHSVDIQNISPDHQLIIRSHGEKKDVIDELSSSGYTLIDATCPFVKKIHRLMEEYTSKGYEVLLIGDKNHPEIVAAVSYGKEKVWIGKDYDEVKDYPFGENLLVLSQTTLQNHVFKEVEQRLKREEGNLVFINTICNATKNRQDSVRELAQEVDAVIIIGGEKSSNTKKLLDIATSVNKNTYFFENSGNLQVKKLLDYDIIGIGAGASTPEWVISEVIEKLLKEKE